MFEGKTMKLMFLNVHRILDSTASSILKSRTQCDRLLEECDTAKECRTRILQEISTLIIKAKNEGINDFIPCSNFNQNEGHQSMQTFMRNDRLFEVCRDINQIEDNLRERTFVGCQNQLDAVFAAENAIPHVHGSKLTNFNEIIITDHQEFIFDLDINSYFSINHSRYDFSFSNNTNPNNRKEVNKFIEKLEEYVKQVKLEKIVNRICSSR